MNCGTGSKGIECGEIAVGFWVTVRGVVHHLCETHIEMSPFRTTRYRNAPVAPVAVEEIEIVPTRKVTREDVIYIGRTPHPHDIIPGTMGRMMLGHLRRTKEVAADRGLTVREVKAQIQAMRIHL